MIAVALSFTSLILKSTVARCWSHVCCVNTKRRCSLSHLGICLISKAASKRYFEVLTVTYNTPIHFIRTKRPNFPLHNKQRLTSKVRTVPCFPLRYLMHSSTQVLSHPGSNFLLTLPNFAFICIRYLCLPRPASHRSSLAHVSIIVC